MVYFLKVIIDFFDFNPNCKTKKPKNQEIKSNKKTKPRNLEIKLNGKKKMFACFPSIAPSHHALLLFLPLLHHIIGHIFHHIMVALF